MKKYKIFGVILVFLLLSFISFSDEVYEIKEIETIEDYSKQFLDESFILDDLKEESPTQVENVEEEPVFSDDTLGEKTNTEEISEKEYIDKVDRNEDVPEKEKLISEDGIDWSLNNNYRAVLIGDLNGNIFFSKNADKIYPLASVTKIMTLLVTFDEIKAGRASLKDKIKISKELTKIGGSGIPLKEGQVYTLLDLIKASAIYSANNATYAIAKHIGKGNINKFIEKMNAKAKKLGLSKDLKYFSPAGLPTRMTKVPMDSGTARAIYKLSLEALKYKEYIEIAGIKKTAIHNGKIQISNRNKLLGKSGVYGIKTGYHKEAKYNITVASKINGMDVVVVVMGGDSYTTRDKVVLDILDIFTANYHLEKDGDESKIVKNSR